MNSMCLEAMFMARLNSYLSPLKTLRRPRRVVVVVVVVVVVGR